MMYQKACDLKDKQACKYLKSLLEKRYLFDENSDYKWRLINQKAKMFIPPQLDDIKPIENNFNGLEFFTIEK